MKLCLAGGNRIFSLIALDQVFIFFFSVDLSFYLISAAPFKKSDTKQSPDQVRGRFRAGTIYNRTTTGYRTTVATTTIPPDGVELDRRHMSSRRLYDDDDRNNKKIKSSSSSIKGGRDDRYDGPLSVGHCYLTTLAGARSCCITPAPVIRRL